MQDTGISISCQIWTSCAEDFGEAGFTKILAGLFGWLRVFDHAHEVLLVVHVALAIDVANVGLRRAFGDVELLLDVSGVVALGQEEQDFRFPARQQKRVGHRFALAAEAPAAAHGVVAVRGLCGRLLRKRRAAYGDEGGAVRRLRTGSARSGSAMRLRR